MFMGFLVQLIKVQIGFIFNEVHRIKTDIKYHTIVFDTWELYVEICVCSSGWNSHIIEHHFSTCTRS